MIIKTIAPIALEDLKKYFVDKSVIFIIDYKNSKLQGTKLLTYLSNLDIPSNIDFYDCDRETKLQLLKEYMQFGMIANIKTLEYLTMQIIEEAKGLFDHGYKDFIEENSTLIDSWISKLDSLTIYNMYIINSDECREFALSFDNDDTDDLAGVNFVSLLKHQDFYTLYEKIDQSKLKFYSKYFQEYIFKGKNLYSYWANENNPLFLLTFAISNGDVDSQEYMKVKKETIEELINVTPV